MDKDEFWAKLEALDEEQVRHSGNFRFTRRHQRFHASINFSKPWTKSGNFVFSSRIRKVGTSNWLRQDYYVPIDVTEHEGDESKSDT